MARIWLARIGRWVCLGLVVIGVALGFGAVGALAVDQDEVVRAFAGVAQLVEPGEERFHLPPEYDLRAYAAYDDIDFFPAAAGGPVPAEVVGNEAEWIDGAARGLLQSSMRSARESGASAETPAELYLLSPSVHIESLSSPALHVTYPPDGAVFPPNLCAPTVEWDDPENDVWQVELRLAGTEEIWRPIVRQRRWRIPDDVWGDILEAGPRARWQLRVRGLRTSRLDAGDAVVQVTPVQTWRTSRWPADSVIVYRMVIPPFNTRKTPDTFYRRLDQRREHAFLLARDQYCFNCHTFSSKTGNSGMFSVQARFMSSGYRLPVYLGVYDIAAGHGWKVELPFEIQMSTYMSWDRQGRYLAFSANQQLVTFHPTVFETQFAGEPTSDVAIYDVARNETYVLAGADDPHRLELLPRFTPDGTRVVFASGPVGLHPAMCQYDLCVVPFNEGRGGAPRLIPGAAANGRSNYYPRFSPDGRWMSFCQADAGILIKSSSDIFLLGADLRGEARRLESNAAHAADSWHSWSSNSHWLVFASKRDDGIFARLYLTEIDQDGHASPAIRLPLDTVPMASFNLPEFLAAVPRMNESELFEVVRVQAAARQVTQREARP